MPFNNFSFLIPWTTLKGNLNLNDLGHVSVEIIDSPANLIRRKNTLLIIIEEENSYFPCGRPFREYFQLVLNSCSGVCKEGSAYSLYPQGLFS